MIESINSEAVNLLVQALDSAGRVGAMDISIWCFLNNSDISRCIRDAYFKTAPFKYSLEVMPLNSLQCARIEPPITKSQATGDPVK